MDQRQLGQMLRHFRQKKKLSINGLAESAGVSAGMISQIERCVANPSLKILDKLRVALEVPLSALLESHPVTSVSLDSIETRYVRRANGRPTFNVGKAPLFKELLSPSGVEGMQFMIIHMPPHSESDEVIISPGQKAGIVLKGELILSIERHQMILMEGDSFQFESTVLHGIRNRTNTTTDILWIMASSVAIHL